MTDTLDTVIEDLIGWADNWFGVSQFSIAKEEFFWKTGKVFDDDGFFDQRMGYFLDYFLFQRLLQREGVGEGFLGKTPYEVYCEVNKCDPPIGYIHSVFSVLRTSKDRLVVSDMFDKRTMTVGLRAGRSFEGLRRKDILQGYLYYYGGVHYLSHGFFFHPSAVAKLVKKTMKTCGKGQYVERDTALSRLARQQLRCLRHVNVDTRVIYSQDN